MSATVPSADAIAETVAYVSIRRLQSRYADILNCRAWDDFAEIMRPSCKVVIEIFGQEMTFTGPDEIGAFLSSSIAGFGFFEFVILNTVIEVDADAGTAGARMHIYEPRQVAADGSRFDGYGVYHDRFERDDDGRWWFSDRHYQDFTPTGEAGEYSPVSIAQIPIAEL
jgi:hypothetical protein